MENDGGQGSQIRAPRLCFMKREDDGYGFNLHGEKGVVGQYISAVDPGGAADKAGLSYGDRVVEVNGVNVENCKHSDVVQHIRLHPAHAALLVVDQVTDKYLRSIGRPVTSELAGLTSVEERYPRTKYGRDVDEEDCHNDDLTGKLQDLRCSDVGPEEEGRYDDDVIRDSEYDNEHEFEEDDEEHPYEDVTGYIAATENSTVFSENTDLVLEENCPPPSMNEIYVHDIPVPTETESHVRDIQIPSEIYATVNVQKISAPIESVVVESSQCPLDNFEESRECVSENSEESTECVDPDKLTDMVLTENIESPSGNVERNCENELKSADHTGESNIQILPGIQSEHDAPLVIKTDESSQKALSPPLKKIPPKVVPRRKEVKQGDWRAKKDLFDKL